MEPELYLPSHDDKLVILDEGHRVPNVFQILRGLIDRNRRAGRRTGQFLLLGSASIDPSNHPEKRWHGRIAYLEMQPGDGLEVPVDALERLWLLGGFTDSFLASSDHGSMRWRQDFIRNYLERDIPRLGRRIPAETLKRFWNMLAHHQSGLLDAAELARSLGVDGKTVVLPRSSCRPAIGASSRTLACQCRQAVGQIAKSLCQGQRHRPCAAWAGKR